MHEAEEARTRPMGAGDLLGDLGEGRIIHTGIFEAVFRHRDGVRASMPFAYEPGAWLQAEAGIRGDSACGLEDLRQRLQLAPGRLASPPCWFSCRR